MIKSEMICDSLSQKGHRMVTFRNRGPRFVHSEFMTHRKFSRCASSSRAVPVDKLLQEVRSDLQRAAPVFWGREQPGMQTVVELDDTDPVAVTCNCNGPMTVKQAAMATWAEAAHAAALYAEHLFKLGVHKSIPNRLLGPFSHINVVATATDMDNFFGLRLDSAAEPTMRALAEAMWAAYNESTPTLLLPGEWHLPFVSMEDDSREIANHYHNSNGDLTEQQLAIRVSVARCARTSYTSFETGKRSTVTEDLRLYQRLVGAQPMHASPAEHQGTPDAEVYLMDTRDGRQWVSPNRHLWGNLTGWVQYRKTLTGEDIAPLPKEYARG